MFHLYHSNDLDVLRGILVKLMADQPPPPFEQEAILVQSQGMAHWLKLQLADGLGVAAQIDFPLPSSFVWKIFNQLKPELPERSHFEKQAMSWKLMRLLPTLIDDPNYQAIRHYLEDDTSGLKCYQLAHKIADVFDQYLVYRPDWLLNWEMGQDQVPDTDVNRHPWQPHLWRALIKDSERLGHSLEHRASLLQQLESLVREYPERLNNLPKRLFVFGIAALPGSYWDVLQAISSVIDVHFFLLNPCRNFWGDIVDDKRRLQILKKQPAAERYFERGNPLLASWGKLGKEFLTLVHDSEISDIEAYVEMESASELSLLKQLQNDILTLQDKQKAAFTAEALEHSYFKQPIAADDNSIQFVSAHSPLREVQQLHDQLLSWFDNDKNLKPRDIVVMVPDIDQYAPYIDAVFSSVADHTRIPWAIADQSMVQENPVIDSWLKLVGLAESRLLITEVQDWLDVAAIRQRFDVSEDDVEQLKDWLQRAEIRWGLNSDHRQSLGLPGFEQNSWRKGLKQLMLGLMLPDDAGQWQQDFPVSAVEGNDGELLGKLLALIDQLEYWQQRLNQPHSIQQWQQLLLQLTDDFYLPELSDSASLQKVRDAIERWQEGLLDAAFDQPLSPQVVRSWFVEQLGQQGGWQRFLAGPVNFCTLMPMRSIPFKAVCMLGMNDEDYPRRVTPIGFDLMVSGNSRRGDRSRRDDDRYLFLEAVCSAQQKLYVSYRGRDARENSELQPSVLVSELQDYICDGYCLSDHADQPHKNSREHLFNHLVQQLPLQPFNPEKYNGYQTIWADVANAAVPTSASENNHSEQKKDSQNTFVINSLPIPDEINQQEVNWQDVKQALLNPCKFFVQRRLRANLDIYWQHHQTEEPFVPDGLELFQLRQQWLQQQLSQAVDYPADQSFFLEQQHALGKLPVNRLGAVWADDIQQEMTPLAQTLKAECIYPLDACALQLSIGDPDAKTRVIGELQQAYLAEENNAALPVSDLNNAEIIRHRVGGIRGQHLLDAWLDLVLAAAAQPGLVSHASVYGVVKGKDKKSSTIRKLVLKAPTQLQALDIVDQCLTLYWQCWQGPVDFIPDLLWESLLLSLSDKLDGDVELIEQEQQKLMLRQINSEFSPLHSVYIQRCLPELVEQLSQPDGFSCWYQQHYKLLADLHQHLRDDELLAESN
jgi:exodeoxyribonuclease V gamma subunit